MTEVFIPNKLVKAGEAVFREGDAADEGLYYICSGEVVVSRTEYGQYRELARLGEGDVFGEMGIINAAPRNATVMALSDCAFFTLSRTNFQHRVNQLDPMIRGAFKVFVLTIRDLVTQRDALAAQLQQMAQQILQAPITEAPSPLSAPEKEAGEAPSGLASGVARKLTY